MKKFTGFNWTLIGLFLILFIIYGACRNNNSRGMVSVYQSGGASTVNSAEHSPESTADTNSTVNQDTGHAGTAGPATSVTGPAGSATSATGSASSTAGTSATSDSSHSGFPVPRACVAAAQATTERLNNANRDDIRNPQYPVENIPSTDARQNTIIQQRRLIREYQSYIKRLRGQCCRRLYSGQNLLDNPLSNKNWDVRPMIANGGDNAMNLMQDDFSNIMNISANDAEKFRVSFFDQEPAAPRTFALQASENWPMYQRTFDRSFVSRIPDIPTNLSYTLPVSADWSGSSQFCPASKSCQGTMTPPWTTNGAYTCEGLNFDKPRAPEPGSICKNRLGQPPPYLPNQSPPPASDQTNKVPTTPPSTNSAIPAIVPDLINSLTNPTNTDNKAGLSL